MKQSVLFSMPFIDRELIMRLADADWLDDATKTVSSTGGERMLGGVKKIPTLKVTSNAQQRRSG